MALRLCQASCKYLLYASNSCQADVVKAEFSRYGLVEDLDGQFGTRVFFLPATGFECILYILYFVGVAP